MRTNSNEFDVNEFYFDDLFQDKKDQEDLEAYDKILEQFDSELDKTLDFQSTVKLFEAKRYQEALKECERIVNDVQYDTEKAKIFQMMASIYCIDADKNPENYIKSKECFEKVLSLNVSDEMNSRASFSLGQILMKLDQRGAQKFLKKSLKYSDRSLQHPSNKTKINLLNNASINYNLGKIYFEGNYNYSGKHYNKNYPLSRRYFIKSLKSNFLNHKEQSYANYCLGIMDFDDSKRFKERRLELLYKAIEYFNKSLQGGGLNDKNRSKAKYYIGVICLIEHVNPSSEDINLNYKIAETYLLESLGSGYLNPIERFLANCSLGTLYFNGQIDKYDVKRGIGFFEKVLEGELTPFRKSYANYCLGRIHLLYSNHVDYNLIVQYLEKSLENSCLGSKETQWVKYCLGDIYFYGRNGVIQDFNKALNYLQYTNALNKLRPRERARSAYILGEIYSQAGVHTDINKAKDALERSLEGNFLDRKEKAWATHRLGEIYLQGFEGSDSNDDMDKVHLKQLLDGEDLYFKENTSVDCLMKGIYLKTTEGGSVDMITARKCLDELIKSDYLTQKGIVNANYSLGKIYYQWEGDDNAKKALDYFKASLEGELLGSQEKSNSNFLLGTIYLKSLDVNNDVKKAKDYFEKSLEGDFLSAKGQSYVNYYLGRIYLKSLGVNNDPKKARDYFEKSMKGNFLKPREQSYVNYYLGNILNNSDGNSSANEDNYQKAREYYEKSLKGDCLSPKIAALTNYHLGVIYFKGLGGTIDVKMAINYFNKSLVGDFLNSEKKCYVNDCLGEMAYATAIKSNESHSSNEGNDLDQGKQIDESYSLEDKLLEGLGEGVAKSASATIVHQGVFAESGRKRLNSLELEYSSSKKLCSEIKPKF